MQLPGIPLLLYKQHIDSSFNNNLLLILNQLNNSGLGNYSKKDFINFVGASRSLCSLLIDPVNKLIRNKRLIIIPDGELAYLSYDILLTSMPDTSQQNYRDLPYLIKDHPIDYSSSSTILFSNDLYNRPHKAHNLIAFAPSYNPKSLTRGASVSTINKPILLPIPGVEDEVKGILKIFNGQEYLNQDASETTFKKYAGNYEVLHLAMHTIIDDHNPMYSKLVFNNEKDTLNDGYLNTYELFNLNLNGHLAVLSACNTGSGKLEKGEGVISLARGFIHAGIPSIVMTLWEVEDHSSANLMISFYKYLSEGKSIDIALQKAKLDYLNSSDMVKSHPYYWAAYVNIGKSSSIPLPSNSLNTNTLFITLFIIFILLITFLLVNRYKHQKKGLTK